MHEADKAKEHSREKFAKNDGGGHNRETGQADGHPEHRQDDGGTGTGTRWLSACAWMVLQYDASRSINDAPRTQTKTMRFSLSYLNFSTELVWPSVRHLRGGSAQLRRGLTF